MPPVAVTMLSSIATWTSTPSEPSDSAKIPLLIPLALRGVAYKPIGASALLRRNLFIYGLGGIIVPFIGIKLIDMLVSVFF